METLVLVAGLEWRMALARRRALALGTFIPVVLVGPVAFGGAPPHHAAVVFTLLFTLFGTFGAAIPLVRDAETGLLQRIALTGAPPRGLLLGRILAGAAVDFLQLAPALFLVILASATQLTDFRLISGIFSDIAALGATLALALVTANLLGTCVAVLARSIAEAALFAAVVVLFALHAAGVFRTPAPGTFAAALEAFIPFRPLHETLLAVLVPTTSYAPGPGAAPAVLVVVSAVALAAVLAPRWLASSSRIRGR